METERTWPIQEKDKEGNIQSEAENENEQHLFEKENYKYTNKRRQGSQAHLGGTWNKGRQDNSRQWNSDIRKIAD